MALPSKVSLTLVAACVLATTVPRVAAAQHITVDGRFSPAQTLAGPNYAIGANLGKQVGSNLFHSFGQFGLSTCESAAFNGPATINNVVGRVTGGSSSSIDGKIQSNIAGANLYLINPNGIVFGPNATVNVSGSFHASTADYVKMSDGAKFQATNPDASTLSAAPPAAFGFLTASPATITVNGSSLGVPQGQTLGLVGGPVAITSAATLSAPGGTVAITSIANPGEAPVDPRNSTMLTASGFGPVSMTGVPPPKPGASPGPRSQIDVRSGGSVFIRSGSLTLKNSTITDVNSSGADSIGEIKLTADTKIDLGSSSIFASSATAGPAANVSIQTSSTGSVVLEDAFSITSGPASIPIGSTINTGAGTGSRPGGSIAIRTGTLKLVGSGLRAVSLVAGSGGTPGDIIIDAANDVILLGSSELLSDSQRTTGAGNITIHTGNLTLSAGSIMASTSGTGPGGKISIDASGDIVIEAGPLAGSPPPGIRAIESSRIEATTSAPGDAGNIEISAQGTLSIRGAPGPINRTGIFTLSTSPSTGKVGNAGNIVASVGALSITNGGTTGGAISTQTYGPGRGGNITLTVAGTTTLSIGGVITAGNAGTGGGGSVTVIGRGPLSLSDPGSGILASAEPQPGAPNPSGKAGSVNVTAPQITIRNGAQIASTTAGTGAGGSVDVVTPGALVLDGAGLSGTQISASSTGMHSGPAGDVTIAAGNLTVEGGAQIASSTAGPGKGGDIGVTVTNGVTLSGQGPSGASGITAAAERGSSGQAGEVTLSAGGAIALSGGAKAASSTAGSGKGGTVRVTAQGMLTLTDPGTRITASAEPGSSGDAGSVVAAAPQITITTGAEIASTTAGTGMGGSVTVTTPGMLVLDGAGLADTRIAASATGLQSGPGGSVTIAADSLTVTGGAQIASSTAGPGKGGDIAVNVANGVTLSGQGPSGASGITAAAEPGSSGQAGQVVLMAGGAITLSGGAKATSSTAGAGNGGTVEVDAQGPLTLRDPGTGIVASATSTGNAGSVMVAAPQIALMSGGEIASTTAGTGAGGSVDVVTPGALVLDGAGLSGTQISASSTGLQSGPGGSVTVKADALAVEGGAQIASSTAGPGKGGDIAMNVTNGVTLSGQGPNGASGITAAAEPGSSGQAGEVVLRAGGAIALSGGAKATSSTAGAGNGGTIEVTAQGPLTLRDSGTGIIASATSTASGNAGSVVVAAPQITVTTGAEIASTTAGTGAGGSVTVTTPGMLVLDGGGDPNTQIAASAIGPQSGPGGSVTVQANTLTVERGAQIASSTAGSGNGGDVNVTAASDIVLPDPGPQITTRSTSSGNAGSITVSAHRLLMNNNAAISTDAETSTASGGNITLKVRDFLYLTGGEITTSVKGETGNGGNITVDPQLVILNHSTIKAEAVEGHGGNIIINAGEFIASADSKVSATSQKGISGTVEIGGPRVDVNGALVVLSSELRGADTVMREACAAQGGRPQSSLAEAGRGGLPQDPDATLPALYIAGRDVNPNPPAGTDTTEASRAVQTTIHLTMRCG